MDRTCVPLFGPPMHFRGARAPLHYPTTALFVLVPDEGNQKRDPSEEVNQIRYESSKISDTAWLLSEISLDPCGVSKDLGMQPLGRENQKIGQRGEAGFSVTGYLNMEQYRSLMKISDDTYESLTFGI